MAKVVSSTTLHRQERVWVNECSKSYRAHLFTDRQEWVWVGECLKWYWAHLLTNMNASGNVSVQSRIKHTSSRTGTNIGKQLLKVVDFWTQAEHHWRLFAPRYLTLVSRFVDTFPARSFRRPVRYICQGFPSLLRLVVIIKLKCCLKWR